MTKNKLMLLGLCLVMGACSTTEEKYVEKPIEVLYNDAMDQMQQGSFEQAAKNFDEVERQHPYSQWATRAQLMATYAHFRAGKYERATAALDTFIQLHPGSAHIDYAYYLKALSYYEQISPVERDQKMTELALSAFEEVIRRFPNTSYSRDARYKIDLARDHLAGKEMEVGRYYLMVHQPLAALNRFRTVAEQYQTTSHIEEALHRLVECYLALGIKDEAQAAGAVLGYNYPGSVWYTDSYRLLTGKDLRPDASKVGKSWLNRAWGSRFKKE